QPIGLGRGLRLRVDGRYRCLQLIAANALQTQRSLHQLQAFDNLIMIPKRTVLLLQWHQVSSAVDTRTASRVLKKQQRQETQVFRFFGQEIAKNSAQADCLSTKFLSK